MEGLKRWSRSAESDMFFLGMFIELLLFNLILQNWGWAVVSLFFIVLDWSNYRSKKKGRGNSDV